jgi:hypothetical protein
VGRLKKRTTLRTKDTRKHSLFYFISNIHSLIRTTLALLRFRRVVQCCVGVCCCLSDVLFASVMSNNYTVYDVFRKIG